MYIQLFFYFFNIVIFINQCKMHIFELSICIWHNCYNLEAIQTTTVEVNNNYSQ